MKSVIVTGATSYIAVALINRLLLEDYKVYAVTRPKSLNLAKIPKHKNVEIIELDMEEIEQLVDYRLGNVDALYHFAWEGVRGEARNDTILQQRNFMCSVRCINAAIHMNIPCFVGIGSQAEYAITKEVISENTPLAPNTEYGKKKVAVYKYGMDICKANREFRFLWARIFSTYGVGESNNTLIMKCIKKMHKGEEINLSPCQHLWDYTYVDDVAEALFLLLISNANDGAYNISSGLARPLKEFVEIIKYSMASDSKLNFGVIPYGNTIPVQMNPDVSKLEKATGWKAKTSFEKGIRRVIEDAHR